METAPLKEFATWARRELIREVTARIAAVLAPGSPERVEQVRAVAALESAIAGAGGGDRGRASIADKVAYTWFNRIIALRFMDANGYTGIGVVSPQVGVEVGQPEILADAKRGVIDADVANQETRTAIADLLGGTRSSGDPQGEAYALLLEAYCNHWHKAMPFMFEREGDFTELLIPANLLADDSILNRSVKVLTEEVCRDVEVIGWLYQFYISERKDEVFAGFKKNKKAGPDEIPAATQLFTPHWIVRYLVENSVGRLWMLNHPDSDLASQMDYYIAPIEDETDFLEITGPEELTVIDPACGSGHMLTYAFDLLYAIYEEQGYAPSDIPGLILTHNIYGTEIDPRASALAAFALTMKARAKQRTFFGSEVEPKICVIEPISFSPDELEYLITRDGVKHSEEAFWNQFAEADTFGSLIRPDPELTVRLARHFATLDDGGDMLRADALARASRAIDQATYLTQGYAVAIANPPYMGSKQMNAALSQFMKNEYPDSKSDLFAAFIERVASMVNRHGLMAQVTMQSWMFLSSYEKLRVKLQSNASIVAMLHMGNMVMRIAFGTAATVWEVGGPRRRAGSYTYFEIADLDGDAPRNFPAHNERNAKADHGGYFEVSQADFAAIPGSPIVYWLSEKMRGSFATGRPLSEVATIRQGLATTNNGRFTRWWWEISWAALGFGLSRSQASASLLRWFPYNKGGEYRKWYGNQGLVVNWQHDGREIKDEIARKYPYLNGNVAWVAKNQETYFLPSVSWSKVSSGAPTFRAYPVGFIYDVAGTSIFAADDGERAGLLSFGNSQVAFEQLAAVAPTLNYEVGQVAGLSVANASDEDCVRFAEKAIATAKADWDSSETSWNFECNPLVAQVQASRTATDS